MSTIAVLEPTGIKAREPLTAHLLRVNRTRTHCFTPPPSTWSNHQGKKKNTVRKIQSITCASLLWGRLSREQRAERLARASAINSTNRQGLWQGPTPSVWTEPCPASSRHAGTRATAQAGTHKTNKPPQTNTLFFSLSLSLPLFQHAHCHIQNKQRHVIFGSPNKLVNDHTQTRITHKKYWLPKRHEIWTRRVIEQARDTMKMVSLKPRTWNRERSCQQSSKEVLQKLIFLNF